MIRKGGVDRPAGRRPVAAINHLPLAGPQRERGGKHEREDDL
jgi:hypothetical protein